MLYLYLQTKLTPELTLPPEAKSLLATIPAQLANLRASDSYLVSSPDCFPGTKLTLKLDESVSCHALFPSKYGSYLN